MSDLAASHLYSRVVAANEQRSWPSHSHDEGELIWGVDGVVTVECERSAFGLMAGRSLWMPAGTLHSVTSANGASFSCSWLPGAARASRLPARAGLVHLSRLATDTLGYLRDLGDSEYDVSHREAAEHFALGLMVPVRDEVVTVRMPADVLLLAVARRLESGGELNANQAAAMAGRSARTLSRHWVAETGTTFTSWRVRARIRKVCRLLVSGVSASSAAAQAGYASAAAMSSAFRRETGLTPTAWLQSLADQR